MNIIIEVLVYLVVLATAIPIGYFLAWLCKDELVKDRKYFRMMNYFFGVCTILLLTFYFKPSWILSLIYFIIVLLVMIRKSFDNGFLRRK